MVDDPVVFEHTIEAIFLSALGPRLTSRARERLKAAGLDLSRPLLPTYPRDRYLDFVRIAVDELFEGDEFSRNFQLGSVAMQGFRESLVGGPICKLLGVLGPRRALERMTRNFRAANNYTETELTEVGPTAYRLWTNMTEVNPGYVAGILHSAMELTGAHELKVELVSAEPRGNVFEIAWEEEAREATPSLIRRVVPSSAS